MKGYRSMQERIATTFRQHLLDNLDSLLDLVTLSVFILLRMH